MSDPKDCENINSRDQNELDISHSSTLESEKRFAEIVGYIENIIVSGLFSRMRNDFLEKHYQQFTEDEENKLVYMDIYKAYLDTIENYIEKKLVENVPGFNIKSFEEELTSNPESLNEEIYDMLSTFWDFVNFKQMVLEYKKAKEGDGNDFSKEILVIKSKLNPKIRDIILY